MSILNSFDNKSRPLVDAGAFYGEKGHFADVCIVSFSRHVLAMFLERYEAKSIGYAATGNGHIEIYLFEAEGKKLLFYMSPIGSAVASMIMYEAHYVSGATKFIVYGSCGVLDPKKCRGRLIIPTESYRDEGLSYHYMKPSDYVTIRNSGKIKEIFERHNLPYVMGRSWTTDGIYMETENKTKERQKDGCIAVEMESSGLQAICNYYNLELYTFFFPADLFEGESWCKADLGGEAEHDLQKTTFDIALRIALEV